MYGSRLGDSGGTRARRVGPNSCWLPRLFLICLRGAKVQRVSVVSVRCSLHEEAQAYPAKDTIAPLPVLSLRLVLFHRDAFGRSNGRDMLHFFSG